MASHLRTQLSDARETVHGKILATDRLGLELAKERQQLARLRELAAAQEAHHKRLQVGGRKLREFECFLVPGLFWGLGRELENVAAESLELWKLLDFRDLGRMGLNRKHGIVCFPHIAKLVKSRSEDFGRKQFTCCRLPRQLPKASNSIAKPLVQIPPLLTSKS